MPTRRLISNLEFKGGYNTEIGPTAEEITHLLRAENCLYSLDGAPYKMPGGARYNATQVTESGSGVAFTGIFDFWRSTSATPSQKFVAVAGTKILKDDNDGVWDTLVTGLTSGAVPSFCTAFGDCIISDDSGTLAPQAYNQTTIAALGGTPPTFPFAVLHRNRVWAPSRTNPSRLHYCVSGNNNDWIGAGSGSVDIDPSDGDIITGAASHKGELIVFKGPNRGSIHRLSGDPDTTLTRTPFLTTDGKSPGLPCVSHNSIVRYGDDLAWASPLGIHSLQATASYGDYREAFLTAPVRSAWRDLARSRDKYIWGLNHAAYGLCVWSVTGAGQVTNDRIFVMDYRFQPPRWAIWPAIGAASICIRQNSSGNRRLFWGNYSGYVVEGDQSTRNIESSAYSYAVDTPHMHFGEVDRLKNGKKFRASFVPQGNYNLGVTAVHDDASTETLDVNLAGGSALLDAFVLDTDTLGGGGWQQSYVDMQGEWRTTQLQLRQGGLNQHVEIHALGVMVTGGDLPES